MTEKELAELIWKNDGPVYTGWPNIGQRIDWCYRDQYGLARDRCFRLARVILDSMRTKFPRAHQQDSEQNGT